MLINICCKIFLHLYWQGGMFGVRYPTDAKSCGFQSQLEASHVSSYNDELWYNETVCLFIIIYIRNGQFNRKKHFLGFIFTPWNRIEGFNETEIVSFSAITTGWPYPKRGKRLSDFDKIKLWLFIPLYVEKVEPKYDKTFNWFVLGNKFEIYLFTEEMNNQKKK